MKSKYLVTGSPIAITYTLRGIDNTVLTEGTDYNAVISPATVQEVGEYTLTITAKDGSGYTGAQTITFNVVDYITVTSSTKTWEISPVARMLKVSGTL